MLAMAMGVTPNSALTQSPEDLVSAERSITKSFTFMAVETKSPRLLLKMSSQNRCPLSEVGWHFNVPVSRYFQRPFPESGGVDLRESIDWSTIPLGHDESYESFVFATSYLDE